MSSRPQPYPSPLPQKPLQQRAKTLSLVDLTREASPPSIPTGSSLEQEVPWISTKKRQPSAQLAAQPTPQKRPRARINSIVLGSVYGTQSAGPTSSAPASVPPLPPQHLPGLKPKVISKSSSFSSQPAAVPVRQLGFELSGQPMYCKFPNCGYVGFSKSEMFEHNSEIHPSTYECPYCDQSFNRFRFLTEHSREQHPDKLVPISQGQAQNRGSGSHGASAGSGGAKVDSEGRAIRYIFVRK